MLQRLPLAGCGNPFIVQLLSLHYWVIVLGPGAPWDQFFSRWEYHDFLLNASNYILGNELASNICGAPFRISDGEIL